MTNALTTLNTSSALTMSSREIAELLNCRHDNVKVTIETLARKGLVAFTESQEKTLGRPATVYHVGKRDSYVIVAQLSPEFTAALVDRWQALEAAQAPAIPQTYAAALMAAAQAEMAREALALENSKQAEVVTTNAIITKTYNDNTVLTFRNDGWFNMTKAAKAFGRELCKFWTRPDTLDFMQALESNSADLAELKAKYTVATVGRYQGGTWAHPDLAVEFVRWCDAKFSVWCSKVIKDILTGAAQVNIVKPEQSEILKMPSSMLEAAEQWLVELRREALKLENAKQAEAIAG